MPSLTAGHLREHLPKEDTAKKGHSQNLCREVGLMGPHVGEDRHPPARNKCSLEEKVLRNTFSGNLAPRAHLEEYLPAKKASRSWKRLEKLERSSSFASANWERGWWSHWSWNEK